MRECVIVFKENWDDHLPIIEFSYNKNYNSCIYMALFEALKKLINVGFLWGGLRLVGLPLLVYSLYLNL